MTNFMIFSAIGIYDVGLVIAVASAFVIFYYFCKKKGVSKQGVNLFEILAIASVIIGFASSMLFQAIYDFIASGVFRWTGMTFLGGLIGGVVTFLLGYKAFGKGRREDFDKLLTFAPICIIMAHMMGRWGCVFRGCCHGKEANWGIYYEHIGHKVIPTNLFEVIFLLGLGIVLWILVEKKGFEGAMWVYLVAYGVFRFFNEFFRGDDRGALLGFISPSQTWAIVMVGIGIWLFFYTKNKGKSGAVDEVQS